MYLDENETKPDIYALSTLIAWLEKQPVKKQYTFSNIKGKCLIGQYMTECGIEHVFGDGQYAELTGRTGWGCSVAATRPHTFGAALARARALLP